MAGEKMRLHGAREMEQVLKQLPGQVGYKVLVQTLRAGAKPVLVMAQETAPYRTGKLQKSVVIRTDKGSASSATVVVGPHPKRGFYGLFHEFGYTLPNGTHVPGKRWMTRAFESTKIEAITIIGQRLGKNIENAAKKLAGSYAKARRLLK